MHSTKSTITTPLLLALLTTLAASQKTITETGDAPIYQPTPTISLNPSDASVIAEYTSAINAALTSEPAFVSDLGNFYQTASIPTSILDSQDAEISVLEGNPAATDAPELTILPASLYSDQLSEYDHIATIAHAILTKDPALVTLAAENVGVEQTGSAEVETAVSQTTKGGSKGVKTTLATQTGTMKGVAGSSGLASGVSSATVTGSPIASAKPTGAAGRVVVGMGGLAAVAVGVVVFL